ncbi:hypothetical protein D9M68_647420 [compost metagenome]
MEVMTALASINMVAIRRQQLATLVASVDKPEAVMGTRGDIGVLPVMAQVPLVSQTGRANGVSLGSMQPPPTSAGRFLLVRKVRPRAFEPELSRDKIRMPEQRAAIALYAR